MSTTTPNIGLTQPDHGEFPNTWDVPANENFEIIDGLFSGTSGHTHDGADGQGPQIDHDDLLNIGTNSHDDIDAHIADGAIHFGADEVGLTINDQDAAGLNGTVEYPSAGWNNGPGSVDLVRELRFRGLTVSSPGTGIVLIQAASAGGATNPGVGVPTHLPPSSAPVAVTDYFNGLTGDPLSRSNWFVTAPQLVELVMSPQGARLSQDMSMAGVAAGSIINRVKCQVPHSEVQRVTLHLCRVGTDGFVATTNRFMIQLALMSSAYQGSNTLSRLGFFFRIEVYKVGSTIYMDRSLFAIPTVLSNGIGQVSTLWSDSGPVTNARHYQGAHEFSLDRNHQFHYLYNNGPVSLGTAGAAGAATPFVAPLMTSLSQEPALLAGGQLTPTTQVGAAPYFGRFGFDVSWNVATASNSTSPGKIDATIEYFTATSVDDERTAYTVVLPQDDCDAADPTPPAEPCCPTLEPPHTVGDHLVVVAPSPYGGSPHGFGAPLGAGGGEEPDVVVSLRIVGRIADGDATYGHAGFLARQIEHLNDPAERTHVVFCEAPDNVTIEIVEPLRPGTPNAMIRIRGDRIPSLVGRPRFAPAAPDFLLATNGAVPPGAGAYPQPIPFPVPSQPGVVFSQTSDVLFGAGVWTADNFVDTSVISNIRWHRDTATGDLIVVFDVGDGLPYGAALDIVIPFLVHEADYIVYSAHPAIRSRLILHPPKPEWVAAKFFKRTSTGAWAKTTDVVDLSTVYLVAYGRRLPLPIVKEADTTPTLWAGFPVDLAADLPTKYVVIDADTGQEAVGVTVDSMVMWKGWYDLEASDFPVGAAFPPTGNTPVSLLGETVFAKLSLAGDMVGRQLFLRAVETEDPALMPADLNFPAVIAATPVIEGVTVSSTALGTGRTFSVVGRGFVDVAVTLVSGNASDITAVSTGVDGLSVAFTADLDAPAGSVVFRLRNYAGTGAHADLTIVSADATTPVITSVSPGSFVEGAVSLSVTVNGSADTFMPGAVLSITPDVAVTPVVHSVTLTTGALNKFVVVMDIPDNGGVAYNIDFLVTNPNGDVSSVETIAVAPPTTPAVTAIDFYPKDDYGGAVNAQGAERAAAGWIKLTGTSFRAGSTVTVDVPEMVMIGDVTIVSATEAKVWYEIGALATIGQVVAVTFTDVGGSAADTTTFTVESRTPVITTVNVANMFEGAGAASAPAGSAKVYVAGKFFHEDGASAITSVAGSGAASLTYPGDVSVPSAGLIVISKLVLSANSAGQTATITVSVGSKTATYSFTVLDQPLPEITAWHVLPGPAATVPLDPIVVEAGATNYKIRLYGSALSTHVSAVSAILDAATISGGGSINANYIELTSVTVPAGPFTNPTVYARLTLTGGGSFDLPLFQVVSVTGTPAVSDVVVSDVVESTRGGSVQIIGTDLGPSVIGSVTYEATDPALLPLSVAPNTTVNPVAVTILSQSSEQIILGLSVADIVGTADAALTFALKFYAPDGSDISDAGAPELTVSPFPGRVKFAAVVPSITTTAGSTNTGLTYNLEIDGASGAAGGEFIEVVRFANRIATQALTGGLAFNTGTSKITRTSGSWLTDGFRAGDYVDVTSAEDARNNGRYKISAIGGTGDKELTIVTAAVPAGYPAYDNSIDVTNATDTSAVVSLAPVVAHVRVSSASPTQVKTTFVNPAKTAEEVEVRLVSRDGRILDMRRFTTT